ncbi:MAG: haloacid dehalogenase-like hydrolase [Candidatus Loosdrechtia sp.]|uniref:haloacid dehalogenase-like hydrolase n=1 Tax=Candidatus Loosdrechtia sp. TaxID=3101272 RepID=UPI003A5DB243|nr:MAG: hypothetical protein QY305_10350 [Candidatus Jettenia sp. AMX2]
MIHTACKKIIILDVDGVIFRGQFLLHLARSLGFLIYIRTALLCLLFNMNKNTIHQLLTKAYERFKGTEFNHVQNVYKNVPLIKNARKTIGILQEHGYSVILMSSGVPDIFVKDLAARVSAGNGYGIEIDVRDGRLTGRVSGCLAKPNGKKQLVEKILRENNLTWQNAIVLVDDRNNLDIMHSASLNIGVHAHYPVRKRAHYLIDSGDLSEVLDILALAGVHSSQMLFNGMRKQFARSWHKEIRRKIIHIMIACVPLFSGILYYTTITALFGLLVIYTISECLRINGYSLPLVGIVTRSSIRKEEERSFAFGPVTLILGASASLCFFPPFVANIAIWIVAFADTLATLAGRKFGFRRLPYNKKKSLEGTLTALVVAFFCGFFYLPAPEALLTAVFSSIIESLPLKSLDNLFMPLCTGIFLMLLGYP